MASRATLRKNADSAPADKTLISRLGRDDWLDAAFRAAVEHGFDGVRVLTLADTLQVTRGSFYWHFKDRPWPTVAKNSTTCALNWRCAPWGGAMRMSLP